MKIQSTIIFASILSILAVATIFTVSKSSQPQLNFGPQNCFDYYLKDGYYYYGQNICDTPMKFTFAIETKQAYDYKGSGCLKKGEGLIFASKIDKFFIGQQEC